MRVISGGPKKPIVDKWKCKFNHTLIGVTPPKINIEHEHDDLEDDFPLPGGVFSGSMLIFLGVCLHFITGWGPPCWDCAVAFLFLAIPRRVLI